MKTLYDMEILTVLEAAIEKQNISKLMNLKIFDIFYEHTVQEIGKEPGAENCNRVQNLFIDIRL